MSSKADLAPPQPTSLIRQRDETAAFPGLKPIGERLARALRGAILDFGAPGVTVSLATTAPQSFSAWRNDQESFGALCRFHLPPIKGTMLMSVPPPLIIRLVDLFYGGTGEIATDRSEFTAAEARFLTRFGEQCTTLLAAAWADVVAISPVLARVETDIKGARLGKESDLVAVQTFSIALETGPSMQLNCLYPVAALRPIEALGDTPQTEAVAPIDPVWRQKLTEAVFEARLPVRSIFARPELPVSRLLSLKPGDIIPVCLPNHIPVTVAGRLFARGTVGESSGRAAIMIEKIEQGSLIHE
jgi:flagellar motor switch protein FliM